MRINGYYSRLFVIAILVLVIAGCSKLKGKASKEAVPKEQINMDVETQKIATAGGDDWDFSKDTMRCFEVIDNKSIISASEATLFIGVAAAQGDMNAKLGTAAALDTLFGGVRLYYKKNGEKWTLEKVASDNLSRKRLGEAQMAKFFEIAAPVCSYYEMKK